MAQTIMLTAFPWLKTICQQRSDGSKHYVSKVSIVIIRCKKGLKLKTRLKLKTKKTKNWLETKCKQRFDGLKYTVNSVLMAI